MTPHQTELPPTAATQDRPVHSPYVKPTVTPVGTWRNVTLALTLPIGPGGAFKGFGQDQGLFGQDSF